MDKIIELKNICKIYGEDEPVYALDHVSLQIERGESVAIMGTSRWERVHCSIFLGF